MGGDGSVDEERLGEGMNGSGSAEGTGAGEVEGDELGDLGGVAGGGEIIVLVGGDERELGLAEEGEVAVLEGGDELAGIVE
jgi:hypothetical protein